MTTISRRLERQYPADDKGWGAKVVPLHDDLVEGVRRGLLVLLGAVACVLLIACANLANLLLARVLGRSREIAIRAAVGASRRRVVQQLLIESALLALAGAVVGLAIADWGVGAIVKSFGQSLPRSGEIALDGRVLAFTAVVAVAAGFVAGIAPAWRMTRCGRGVEAGHGARRLAYGRTPSAEHARHVRSRARADAAVGASLLIRSLWGLRAVDPGIDPHSVVTMEVLLPRPKYPEPDQRDQFMGESWSALPDQLRWEACCRRSCSA